jgi:hypothetical protein
MCGPSPHTLPQARTARLLRIGAGYRLCGGADGQIASAMRQVTQAAYIKIGIVADMKPSRNVLVFPLDGSQVPAGMRPGRDQGFDASGAAPNARTRAGRHCVQV